MLDNRRSKIERDDYVALYATSVLFVSVDGDGCRRRHCEDDRREIKMCM